MAGEWREVAVEELKARTENALATGPFGSSISSRFFTESGVPVIRGSNLSEDIGTRLNDDGLVFLSSDKAREFTRSIVREGDLVFTCWGTVNQVGLIDGRAMYREYVISNKQMKLTPDPEKADSLFLYYLFSSPELQDRIKNQSIGSSVPGFNLGQLRGMRIHVPEVGEQRAIAHILGTLDDKIELNRRMNETLEAMARAIFKSWFVDFDPVRAKMNHPSPSGRGAGGEGTKPTIHPNAPVPPGLLDFAREIRRECTDAEALLWRLLRGRQLANAKFRRQHPFPPYILDFYCHDRKLAIELDGGQHNEAPNRNRDARRDEYLAEHGIRVLRFWNNEILRETEAVLEAIYAAVEHAGVVPSPPAPLPGGEGSFGLPKPLADLFPARLVDSELGEIPEGWEVARFADTIETVGGGTPKTSVAEYWDGDIPWFSVVDAPTGSQIWVVDTEKKVTRAGIETSSTRVLPVGTTIISARGTVGRIALVGVPMAMNQSCYGLRGRFGAKGFYNYFSTRELVARLQQHSHGSVFDTITRDTLASIFVVEPPASLIDEFETRVGPYLERIRTALLDTRTLAALRDTLLPKLISGQLRVKAAERFVAETA